MKFAHARSLTSYASSVHLHPVRISLESRFISQLEQLLIFDKTTTEVCISTGDRGHQLAQKILMKHIPGMASRATWTYAKDAIQVYRDNDESEEQYRIDSITTYDKNGQILQHIKGIDLLKSFNNEWFGSLGMDARRWAENNIKSILIDATKDNHS